VRFTYSLTKTSGDPPLLRAVPVRVSFETNVRANIHSVDSANQPRATKLILDDPALLNLEDIPLTFECNST